MKLPHTAMLVVLSVADIAMAGPDYRVGATPTTFAQHPSWTSYGNPYDNRYTTFFRRDAEADNSNLAGLAKKYGNFHNHGPPIQHLKHEPSNLRREAEAEANNLAGLGKKYSHPGHGEALSPLKHGSSTQGTQNRNKHGSPSSLFGHGTPLKGLPRGSATCARSIGGECAPLTNTLPKSLTKSLIARGAIIQEDPHSSFRESQSIPTYWEQYGQGDSYSPESQDPVSPYYSMYRRDAEMRKLGMIQSHGPTVKPLRNRPSTQAHGHGSSNSPSGSTQSHRHGSFNSPASNLLLKLPHSSTVCARSGGCTGVLEPSMIRRYAIAEAEAEAMDYKQLELIYQLLARRSADPDDEDE